MTIWKKCVWNLWKYIYFFFLHNVHMYIITAFTQLQSQVFFGYDTTSFDHHLAIICHSPPHLSSSVRLDGADIFMFLQKYLIGFKLRLWLGHSKTLSALCISHSCCVFRFIVLLEGKSSARLRFWMLWTGFSLTLSLYLGGLSFSSTPMCSSVPAAEKQPHSMRLLPAHFTFGMYSAGDEQSWFPSNMMLIIEVHQTREYYFSQCEGA